MVFHELECIFLHIGKTAGVSVEHWLRDGPRQALIADRDSLFGWDPDERVYLQHATADTVRRLAGADVFDRYYKFTVVRNPFARAVSVYHYLIDQHREQYGTFENYVRALPDVVRAASNQKGSHHLPQVRYTHIEGRRVCDHVAHFERLPGSLDPVRSRLGITRSLPHHNRIRQPARSGVNITDIFSDAMMRIVLDVYADDFAAFGYSRTPADLAPMPGEDASLNTEARLVR